MSRKAEMMKILVLGAACAALLAVAASGHQTGEESKDPVTGKWGSDGLTYLDLKFDGKSSVFGTTIWRHGSGYERRADIRTGTFDPKTGVLKLEGEARGPDDVIASWIIEGRIEGNTVAGTYKFGEGGGEFTFRKQ